MKTTITRQSIGVAVGATAVAALLLLRTLASQAAAPPPSQATDEKEACTKNLKVIYQAIQAYQAEHKDLPNWLSDLVPQYLPDANVLICPLCRRTGQTEGPPLADPKIPSSYLFEFCPLPLGDEAPNAPTRTRRDWKRRQMGLVGAVVPVVRCRHHQPALNLAFDGTVYESPGMWELAFTNRISAESLTPAQIFATDSPAAANPPSTPRFPARDPKAGPGLIDLGKYYNAALTESWHGGPENDLAALPCGLQTLAGAEFDVRGIVQLGGLSPSASRFPTEIKGITINQKCQRLHFLHAAAYGTVPDEGKQLGAYVVHFATNQMRLEIPITYGRELRDWHVMANEPPARPELTVAWTGTNGVSKRAGSSIRLFLTTWLNPVPSVPIESIDVVTGRAGPAPFLIAITAE